MQNYFLDCSYSLKCMCTLFLRFQKLVNYHGVFFMGESFKNIRAIFNWMCPINVSFIKKKLYTECWDCAEFYSNVSGMQRGFLYAWWLSFMTVKITAVQTENGSISWQIKINFFLDCFFFKSCQLLTDLLISNILLIISLDNIFEWVRYFFFFFLTFRWLVNNY